jgi:hypothetical protein
MEIDMQNDKVKTVDRYYNQTPLIALAYQQDDSHRVVIESMPDGLLKIIRRETSTIVSFTTSPAETLKDYAVHYTN